MEKWKIIDDIEEIQDQVDKMGFAGSNEKELWTRDLIADYIVKKLTILDVVDSMRISNDEITDKAYNSLNRTEHLTENHRQGYFHGYKNGCYWMRKKYSK